MDAFDDNDPDSSQAAQVIEDLLEREASPAKRTDSRSSALKTQNNHSNDISSDSLPSSRTSHSIPQYHFHGLASTQTQSQNAADDDEPAEGSQKENIGAAKPNKESPPARPSSPQASSSRNVAAKAPPVDRRGGASMANNEKGPAKRATNAAFQSPRPKGGAPVSPTKPNTRRNAYKGPAPAPVPASRYKAPPRPPARTSSQDSFANEPEINEQYLISKADKFAVPLSELGGGSSPIHDLGTTTSGMSGTSRDLMFIPRTRRQPGPPSPPRGKVLVESTPSNSSQSQSQPSEDGKPSIEERLGQSLYTTNDDPAPMNVDRYGNDYDNSYVHPDLEPSPPGIHPDLLATQPSGGDECDATQPSTQPEDSHMSEATRHTGATATSIVESVLQSLHTARPPTNPSGLSGPSGPSGARSLVAMVNPDVQSRYRQYGNTYNSNLITQNESRPLPRRGPTREPTREPTRVPTPPPAHTICEETQPSEEPPPPRRGFPSKSLASANTTSRALSPPNISSLEIVPDSEPSRLVDIPTLAYPLLQQPKQIQPPALAQAAKPSRKAPKVDDDVEMRAVDEVAEEEEEEEEEEDVPLAKIVPPAKRSRGRPPSKKGVNSKGKGKAAPLPATKKAQPVQKPVIVAPPPKTTHNHSMETTEVPSSMPEQDIPQHQNTRNMRNRPTIIAEAKKQSTQKRPASKQTAKATTSKHQYQQDEDEDMADVERDDEQETELADEEYQNGYEDDEPEPSRKRKRVDKAETVPKAARPGTATRSKRRVPTPGGRSNARSLPSAGASTGRSTTGTRVFALWKMDGHYYSGTVHSTDNRSRYNVKFDDGTNSWVGITDMRICDLRVGDDVIFDDRNRAAKIVGIDDDKEGIYEVNVDGKIEQKVIGELKIANKTILYDWKDRRLTEQSVSTTIKPVRKQLSPSPSKMSMISLPLPSTRGNCNVLPNTALIVTLQANKGNWEKEKNKIMNAVRNSGGFVIDDLSTIFKMEGRLEMNNNRWTIMKSDVKWIGNEEITRVFLISDEYNLKPKFLMALALGIPCLSTSWLHESVLAGKEKEWFPYMLAQGYSEPLHGRPSQQVDVDWGNSIHQLTDIMNNFVPCKLYADKSILCIGPDMIAPPLYKGKRRPTNEEKAWEASTALPRIILAMGAAVVEAVTDMRYASKNLSDYDYLVIREPEQYIPAYSSCTTLHWGYVKECLIASRHLPLPVWDAEYSQEA